MAKLTTITNLRGPQGAAGPQGLPGVGSAAWVPAHAYTAGSVVQAPDGSWLSCDADHTSGAVFDATEQAFWSAVAGKDGTLATAALNAAIGAQVPEVGANYFAAATLGLSRFQKRLGIRGNDNVGTYTRIAWTGDSTGEGVGVSNRRDRTLDRLARTLTRRMSPGTTPGVYIPAQYRPEITFIEKPVITGTVTQDDTRGIGLRATIMTSASTVTFAVNGRWAHIFYLQYPGFGTFSYSIDGGAATTVNTDAAGNNGANVGIDMGTDAAHTVKVAWVSGEVRLFGLRSFTNTTEIHVYDASHCGALAAMFGNAASGPHWQGLAGLGVDLHVVCLGENDYYNTPAITFKADLANVIANSRAYLPGADVMLIASPQPGGPSNISGQTWADILAAMKEVAVEQSVEAFYDMGQRIPPHDTDTLGLWFNGPHRNLYGQGIEGDALAGFLTPR